MYSEIFLGTFTCGHFCNQDRISNLNVNFNGVGSIITEWCMFCYNGILSEEGSLKDLLWDGLRSQLWLCSTIDRILLRNKITHITMIYPLINCSRQNLIYTFRTTTISQNKKTFASNKDTLVINYYALSCDNASTFIKVHI